MTKLKPCPFCGSYNTAINGGNEGYWVSCDKCGADGPVPFRLWDTKQEAIDAWNRRADANSLTEALKRNTTEIVEKANGIYAEYIRHLQERNKALDEELASLLNETDAGIKGR